jgi:hypothetical protein
MDVLTGQFVQAGSPAFFLLLLAAFGVGLFIYSKVNHPGYEKLEDAFKAEVAEVKARMGASFPKFVAEIEADFAALKAKIDAFRKS